MYAKDVFLFLLFSLCVCVFFFFLGKWNVCRSNVRFGPHTTGRNLSLDLGFNANIRLTTRAHVFWRNPNWGSLLHGKQTYPQWGSTTILELDIMRVPWLYMLFLCGTPSKRSPCINL